MRDLVIWKDVRVKIRHKIWHIHKINKRVHRNFCNDHGDIPVCVIDSTTNKATPVVNNRGRAYAARNRQMYRKGYSRSKTNKLNAIGTQE